MMDELDDRLGEVAQRLRSLADAPVDDALVRRHVAAMERVRFEPATAAPAALGHLELRFRRVRVAAATVAAGLLGASGLAAAGALPDPAQDLAADALGVIGLDVPRSSDDCDAPDDHEAAEPGAPAEDCDGAPTTGD